MVTTVINLNNPRIVLTVQLSNVTLISFANQFTKCKLGYIPGLRPSSHISPKLSYGIRNLALSLVFISKYKLNPPYNFTIIT